MNTCRDEILAALERLESRHGRNVFTLDEIATEVLAATDNFTNWTVRIHVTSRMCVDAPAHHGVRYPDLQRVDRGRYRRIKSQAKGLRKAMGV